jgi:hypothetical protein
MYTEMKPHEMTGIHSVGKAQTETHRRRKAKIWQKNVKWNLDNGIVCNT